MDGGSGKPGSGAWEWRGGACSSGKIMSFENPSAKTKVVIHSGERGNGSYGNVVLSIGFDG